MSGKLIGKFVSAKLRGRKEARQGWVISIDPLQIIGQSNTVYKCEGEPVIIDNPPQRENL